MGHSKLFTLLRTIDKNEVVSFQKYLRQLHGDEAIALAVFGYVKKFHPDFRDNKKLDFAYIHRKVFDSAIEENEYNRKRLLNAFSDLHLWLKEYFLSEKANDESFESRLMWLTILKKRGLEGEFSRQARRLQDEVEAQPRKSIQDYRLSMSINHFTYYNLPENKPLPDIRVLLQHVNELNLYYEIARLKVACEALNLKNVHGLDFEPGILPKALDLSTTVATENHPLLLLYQGVYQLLANKRDVNYTKVETILIKHAGKIDPNELSIILTYLRNFASSQVRKGEEQLLARIHQLNKLSTEHGVFAQRGEISTTEFQNIVNTGSKVKDFTWTESFIASQSRYLPADVRDDSVLLANGVMLFEKREFVQIVQKLEHKNFKDLYLLMRLKTLILRCYYELDTDEITILDFCEPFEHVLHRNRKKNEAAVDSAINFIKIVKMLVRKRTPKDLLLKKINDTKNVFFGPWLSEKASKYKAEFATRKRSKRVANS